MDDFGQVNIESDAESWAIDMRTIVTAIREKQPLHFKFAALMSGHSVTVLPAQSLVAYGSAPSGVPPIEAEAFALVAIESWRNALAWIRLDCVKTIDWIEDEFKGTFDNAPDSWALAYLLNSIVAESIEQRGGDASSVKQYLQEIKDKLIERGEKIAA